MNWLIHPLYLFLDQSENLRYYENGEDCILIEIDLADNWIEDNFAQQFPGYTKLSVYQTNRRIMWILRIKAGEMEHGTCVDRINYSRTLP
jgi:hypothetical protein